MLAANRDEFYARETAGPRVLSDTPRVVGGQDLEKGGTWLGVTPSGLFAVITNQRSHDPPPLAPRSRGHVVLEGLRRSAEVDGPNALHTFLAALDPGAQNSFNVAFGDGGSLEVAYGRHDARAVTFERVPEGIHVLPNDRLDSPEFSKVERARELIRPHVRAPWPELVPALRRALADHELPPETAVPEPPPGSRFSRSFVRTLQAICIHTPVYGTRSTTILALAPGGVAHYLYAPGPPCTTPLEDFSDLAIP